jgi:pimeloyl-ACP methyl ester carboxylesterase
MSVAITPFRIDIPQSAIDDLHQRLDLTRWPNGETVDDWTQGAPLDKVKALCAYWRNAYDWRRCEAAINAHSQFTTEIDGLTIHFIHVRSRHENARPIILSHGWPGSIMEFMKVIGPLTDPEAHGGTAEDAFHVVIPSLPGYGFSGKPTSNGWGVQKIAAAWATLMARLGYDRWVAQGGDWGSIITQQIGMQAPAGCVGIHVNMLMPDASLFTAEGLTDEEQEGLRGINYYQEWDSGYSKQQATRPQTLGYGLADSPAAQAAWIYEKMWAWTDNQGAPEDALGTDEMLDNIMLYWLPNNGASSARLYWESFSVIDPQPISLPTGVSVFKDIFTTSRERAAAMLGNIVYWNKMDRGGHFAAWEQPTLFTQELRACFKQMW